MVIMALTKVSFSMIQGSPVNVMDFGAKGDGSTDDTAAIQAAINSLTSATLTGGILFFPTGFFIVTSALTITKGISVLGSGIGVGSGTGNSGGTVIRSTAAAGDVFTVSCADAVIFENIAIDSTVTKAANTAGIRLQGSSGSGSINKRSKLDKLKISNMYDAVVFDGASDVVIHACDILDYISVGIYSKQTGATDAGQSLIHGCVIWDQNLGTSQACIRYDKGGDLKIVGNKLLGSQYGFRMVLDDGPTGTLLFSSNSFEQQTINCADFKQATTGKTFGNLAMIGNEFSILAVSSAQGAVNVQAGISSLWISNIVVSNNVFNMGTTQAQPHINIQDGNGVMVSNNVMTNLGNSGPTAISVGGNATNVQVLNNIITAYPTGKYAAGLNVNTVLVDTNGMTYSELSTLKNGSSVYVTNGTIVGVVPPATTYNFTVTSGGSGCLAFRMNGAWVSIV
jgi:hypothetical protein